MNDRELLELAAKAAGVRIDKSKYNGGGAANTGFDTSGSAVLDWHNGKTWNPLTDDGDALRLAVKLNIDVIFATEIHPMHAHRQVSAWYGDEAKRVDEFMRVPMAATRRAIVRAAAEIGKAMQ